MTELRDVMQAQRACRRFDSGPDVPDDDIERILEAAVHAPSAENAQPWIFVVVRSPETKSVLTELWSQAWQAGGSEYVRSSSDRRLYEDLDHGIMGGGFAAAPVIVMVGADLERVPEIFAPSSIYPAVQNILLAAADIGLATCLTSGLTTMYADKMRDLLALPETVLPMAAVYLGKSDKKLGPPRRRPAAEATYREQYGRSW